MLVARLRASPRERESTRLLRELSNRAVLHVISRERILLPAWRRARWRGLPLDAMTAHVRLKQALAELVVLRPTDDRFADALAEFAAHVEAQQALDHQKLIPVLRDVMEVHERRELCNDMELLFDTGDAPARAELPLERSPWELIREAEIVLSSLLRGSATGDPPGPATAAG